MSRELVAEFQSKSIASWRSEISAAIAETGRLRSYERKRVLFQQGMVSDTVYAIKSGLVEISGLNEAGHEVTSSIRGPGEQFGWAEGLLAEPRSRQATVLQEAELWELGIDAFLALLVSRPRIMLAALGSAVHRETRFATMHYDLRGRTAHTRVAYALLRLAARAAEGAPETPHLRITHEEISRLCELSRQTVTTILGEMQRSGILELGLRSIRILDQNQLSAIVDEE